MSEQTMVIEEVSPKETVKIIQQPQGDKPGIAQKVKVAEEGVKASNVEGAIVGGAEKSRNFVQKFLDYIKGVGFINRCNEISRKSGASRKTVAKTFLGKVLGTIGDVLGITLGTGKDILVTAVDLLAAVLKGGITILFNVAKALVRLCTLNKTVTPDLVY